MSSTRLTMDVESTWTDELNAVLHPFGILLSGEDATSILGLDQGSALERLERLTESDMLQIANSANEYCETTAITPSHIKEAVERTKWHYRHADVSTALLLTYDLRAAQIEKKREITTALYAIARECRWTIGDVHWQTYPMSFYWAEAIQGARKFAVLLEQGAPVAALSSAIPEYFNLHFIDDSDFIAATWRTQAPFAPLRAADLAVPLSNADREFLVGLSAQHERDLKYWKPATVGDVIFNWWD